MKTALEKSSRPQTGARERTPKDAVALLDHRDISLSQSGVDNSSAVITQRMQIESSFGDTLQRQSLEEEEPLLQGKFATGTVLQRQPSPNRTGLPDELKAGVEGLSGLSLDDVRVHYNSSKPAELQALAYTQGTDIHVAPGEERHLPHEAWHVGQQAEGRVRATRQLQSVKLNDDAGLEREADLMGRRALQTREEVAGLQDLTPFSSPAFPKLLQCRALSVGITGAGSWSQIEGRALVQLVALDVGQAGPPHGIRSQVDVLAAAGRHDTLVWPQPESGDKTFNADYSGSVQRAMDWGLQGREGSSGWYGREYQAADFNTIATAAGNASNALAGINPALDNEPNKTLIAIRAFRGPNNGSMAGQTQNDLAQVHAAVTGQAAALYAAGLITNPAAAVTAITADPAEAHPNTLPTARVVFGGAGTVYFKGRSPDVENALVGSTNSAARSLSSLAGANPTAAEGVGMHGFVGAGAGAAQIAGDVGAEVAPILDPVTPMETVRSYLPAVLGGADVPPRPQAVAAWLSAAKGALLASLTATTDLHGSNIKAGRSGKSHIIDAEFLLDITQWQAYQDMLANGAIANFDIRKFVPPWLRAHMAMLSPGTRTLMANAVVAGFNALQANQAVTQTTILAPINALILTPALLRVIPLGTDEFLQYVTTFHGAAVEDNGTIVDQLWTAIANAMDGKITVNNPEAGKPELTSNLQNGMVPLFHVRTNDGAFLLNKHIQIGNTIHGHSVADLLTQTRAAVANRYADITAIVRNAITA